MRSGFFAPFCRSPKRSGTFPRSMPRPDCSASAPRRSPFAPAGPRLQSSPNVFYKRRQCLGRAAPARKFFLQGGRGCIEIAREKRTRRAGERRCMGAPLYGVRQDRRIARGATWLCTAREGRGQRECGTAGEKNRAGSPKRFTFVGEADIIEEKASRKDASVARNCAQRAPER